MKTLTSVKRHALTDTRTSHSSISTTSTTKPPKALDSYSNSTQQYNNGGSTIRGVYDLRGSNLISGVNCSETYILDNGFDCLVS